MSEPILSHTFNFPNLKPFSVNASYVRTFSGVSKSSGATEFAAQVFNILSREAEQLKTKELRAAFDPQKHCFKIHLIAYYPEMDYYTKKQQMSSKTLDCTNWEKILVDCIMLPKFNELPFPQGAPNIAYDDKFVAQVLSQKLPANKLLISATFGIFEKPAVTYLE